MKSTVSSLGVVTVREGKGNPAVRRGGRGGCRAICGQQWRLGELRAQDARNEVRKERVTRPKSVLQLSRRAQLACCRHRGQSRALGQTRLTYEGPR